jgi:hypothetical protein
MISTHWPTKLLNIAEPSFTQSASLTFWLVSWLCLKLRYNPKLPYLHRQNDDQHMDSGVVPLTFSENNSGAIPNSLKASALLP